MSIEVGGGLTNIIGQSNYNDLISRGGPSGGGARRNQYDHHTQSPFLNNANKTKNKSDRARYDNGQSGKNREIYEWDPSHGGEIEVYDSKGNHTGVLDPEGNRIKPAVPGRKIKP